MIYQYQLSHKKLSQKPARPLKRPASAWRATKGFLFVLALVAAVTLVAWGAKTAIRSMKHSGLFELREIRTAGLERLNEAEVVGRLRPSSGRNLFDLDLVSLKGALLTEPWIKEVNLRREYPNTLSIQVLERDPIAVLAGRQGEAIVDETGAVIEEWPNGGEIPAPWSSLPVVHGLEAASLRDRDPRAVKAFSSALEILRAAPATAGQGLDLDVGRTDDLRVQRHGYWLWFGTGPFDEKWERFLSLEGEIERRHDGVREVDLRFPDQVIVR